MRRYLERYEYDAVGNFLKMIHQAANGSWTREYAYEEPSLLEFAKTSNRLSRTSIGASIGATTGHYSHDDHGNMTSMPHLPLMRWDFKDQLQATSRQVVNNGGTPEITYYVYDASGQRVRKVTERQAGPGQTPKRMKERIYLGGFEIYREYENNENNGVTAKLERQTLHLMDDKQRIALVETRTQGNEPDVPQQLIRYQLGNHLGSASLELDDHAQIISYEEFYPYGSTSYQAVRSQTETPKRYRYTGKERDEESGLYYHGARYYAAWLGKWTSCDPAGLVDGLNLYSYVTDQPTELVDREGMNGDPPDPTERDIVYQISRIEKPGDVASFWAEQARPNRTDWAHPLSELEQGYIQAFRDPSTPEALRMRVPVDPTNLTSEERAAAERLFGTGETAASQYANYENRRRILAHYVYTHPATVRLLLGLYRLFRDINPIHFALERGWQIGSGREMFTQQDVSRIGAAAEFLASLALIYGVGRALGAARPTPQFEVPTGPQRALTDPIYDLPAQGGGMRISGRWYSEHALERMAPDTPQVRAELRTRAAARLERLGFRPGNPAYDRLMAMALERIDPRGVPPSVVEAEIANPGSTNVRVITARRGQVVVTVMPRR
jgi:RHS repeat-associated protein